MGHVLGDKPLDVNTCTNLMSERYITILQYTPKENSGNESTTKTILCINIYTPMDR